MITHNFFNDIFVIPILNILVAIYAGLHALGLPGAFGLAIVALTVGIRFLLHPFFKQQIHTARKMTEIKPHLDRLQAQHKKDPKRLQQEQLLLYKEHGLNPASGCLFLIIQMPIFIGLYSTLNV
ncbi:MAG: YidC/Oxa1 family membrane protein insertase, partial [Microgenomates group bacterium]